MEMRAFTTGLCRQAEQMLAATRAKSGLNTLLVQFNGLVFISQPAATKY